MTPNSPQTWKARYPSTVVDVDSSVIVDPQLRDFVRTRQFPKAQARHKEAVAKGEKILADNWGWLLGTPAAGGSKVLAMSRLPSHALVDILGPASGYGVIPEGRPKGLEKAFQWADNNQGTVCDDRVLLTSRAATVRRAAEICVDTRSRIDALLGCWMIAPRPYGTQEEIDLMFARQWCLLGQPTSVHAAARQLAVDENWHPVIKGVPDHGSWYAGDYAYHPLQDAGRLSGSPSETIFAIKEGAKEQKMTPREIAQAVARYLPKPEELFVGNPFIAIHVTSSDPQWAAHPDRQASWHVAKHLVDHSGGLGSQFAGVVRTKAVQTKPKGHPDNVVQRHLDSMGYAAGVGDQQLREAVNGKHVLIVEDTLSSGTQSEALECFLRIHADPVSVSKFGLLRSADHARHYRAKEAVEAIGEAASKTLRLLPFEQLPYAFKNRKHDNRRHHQDETGTPAPRRDVAAEIEELLK